MSTPRVAEGVTVKGSGSPHAGLKCFLLSMLVKKSQVPPPPEAAHSLCVLANPGPALFGERVVGGSVTVSEGQGRNQLRWKASALDHYCSVPWLFPGTYYTGRHEAPDWTG